MNVFSLSGKKAIVDYLATLDWRAALLDSDQTELENGAGYETGGQKLTNTRMGIDGDVAYLDFDNVTWSNAGFSGARYLRISSSDPRESASSAVEFGLIDFGAEKSGQGADFTYKFPRTGGVIRI